MVSIVQHSFALTECKLNHFPKIYLLKIDGFIMGQLYTKPMDAMDFLVVSGRAVSV